jgi:hypothetical protein
MSRSLFHTFYGSLASQSVLSTSILNDFMGLYLQSLCQIFSGTRGVPG